MKEFHYFTLYDLVAMGLYVGNKFLNREASTIEAAETAHVMSLGKGITRPGFPPPRLNFRCWCCF